MGIAPCRLAEAFTTVGRQRRLGQEFRAQPHATGDRRPRAPVVGAHRAAVPRGHTAARALDDGDERRDVPDIHARLDHQIDEAGGEHPVGVAIGAEAAEAHPCGQRVESGAFGRREHVGLCRVEHRIAQSVAGPRLKPAFAEIGALPVAHEPLAEVGLVQHADDSLALVLQRNQGAPGRHAGDERLGAVNRVDDPGETGTGPFVPVLLAENAVVGARLLDECADRGLCLAVGYRHRRVAGNVVLVSIASACRK